MNDTWVPECPHCGQAYHGRAYPGAEDGPRYPLQHPLGTALTCKDCHRAYDAADVTRWHGENMTGWRRVDVNPPRPRGSRP